MLKKISITFKIIFFSAVLAFIFLGISFGYALNKMRGELLKSSLEKMEYNLSFEKNKIDIISGEIRNILFLLKGTPPVQGIIRARTENGIDREGNSTYEEWKTRLETIFASEIETTGLYDQLRYIDEDGNELVRVDYVDGKAKIIPTNELQNKSNRGYFKEAIKMNDGELYISKTDLNREGTPPTISIPYRPVIRYATTIFSNTDNKIKGILIANVLVNSLIGKTEFLNNSLFDVYITNNEGYFIVNKDKNKEWGGPEDLNTGISLDSEFPNIKDKIKESKNGSILNKNNFFFFTKVVPDINNFSREWVILATMPESSIYAPIDKIVTNSIFIGFGTFTTLFIIFLLVIRYLLYPLRELETATKKITAGDFNVQVKVYSDDEIGSVSRAFNLMVKKLKNLYSSLEKKVNEKTIDLDKKIKELERTQLAMINVLEDITSEKKKIEVILESIGDGVFVINNNGTIILFNKISSELTGFNAEEAIGTSYKNILRFIDEKTGKRKDDFIKKTLDTGEIQKTDKYSILIKKDGEKLVVASSSAPLKNNKGEIMGLVVVFRDVSKEREVDKAKTEFVSLASHQLRTPLTSLRLFGEVLANDKKNKLTKKQKGYLKNINLSTLRMINLVNDLLNVSRLESGHLSIKPEPTDLIDLIKSVLIETVGISKEKKLKVKLEKIKDKLPKINIDSSLIHEVLVSLISNAVRYSPVNGKDVSINIQQTEKEYIISVKDGGIGIPEKMQTSIFNKFFRADNAISHEADGSGLGLYIAKKILDNSEGRIWFESKENKGTTFYFSLPKTGMKPKKGKKGVAK